MTHSNYHIDFFFSKRVLNFTVYLLAFISWPFQKLNLRTGVIVFFKRNITKKLNSIYIISEGLKAIVKNFDADKATQEYDFAKNLLFMYRDLYSKCNNVKFLYSGEIKELCDNTLSNFYDIESHLRRTGFAGITTNDDGHLLDFSSQLSLNSLHEK